MRHLVFSFASQLLYRPLVNVRKKNCPPGLMAHRLFQTQMNCMVDLLLQTPMTIISPKVMCRIQPWRFVIMSNAFTRRDLLTQTVPTLAVAGLIAGVGNVFSSNA